MSTASITHRPIPLATAAVALVAAVAIGSLSLAQNGTDSTHPAAPSQPQQLVQAPGAGNHHYPPITSGGKVMVGQ